MELHSTTMTRSKCMLYRCPWHIAGNHACSPCDLLLHCSSSSQLFLLVDGKSLCCFITNRGLSHFIWVATHTPLHLSHPPGAELIVKSVSAVSHLKPVIETRLLQILLRYVVECFLLLCLLRSVIEALYDFSHLKM